VRQILLTPVPVFWKTPYNCKC